MLYAEPLDMCPHMPARCPHKENECNHPKSRRCHYVLAACAAAVTLAYGDGEDAPRGLEKRVREAQEFLNGLDREP